MSDNARSLVGRKLSRRDFIRMGMALSMAAPSISALAGCTAGTPVPTPTVGKRKLAMAYDAVQFWDDQSKEFTQKTGIEFKYEAIPFPQLHDKYLASFMSGGKEYDVVHVRDDYVAEWGPKGFLEPLDSRLTDALRNEHVPTSFSYLTNGGKTYGVPRYLWLWQFYYNTALFQAAGIKDPPATWAEFREIAKKLTKPPVYGAILTLGATMPVNVFTMRIRAEGGEFMKAGMPTFNSPEGVTALTDLLNIIKDGSVDPSSFELTTTGAMTDIFTQGRAGMTVSTPPTLAMAADPAKSLVVGKVQISLIPGSKLKSAGYSELGGIAITSTSADKDAAWEFVKFVTSADQQKKMALAIGRIPTLPALLNDPEVQKKYSAAAIAGEQMKYPSGMAIVVPQQAEINTAVANELTAALRGQKPVQTALSDAEKATLKILGK
jgi:multiple sugar transport system substrate-binding protein